MRVISFEQYLDEPACIAIDGHQAYPAVYTVLSVFAAPGYDLVTTGSQEYHDMLNGAVDDSDDDLS